MSSTEDIFDIYLLIKTELEYLEGGDGWPATIQEGPLCDALDKLSGYPFVELQTNESVSKSNKLVIARKKAGTFTAPDLKRIIQESTPSAFGKGEEWVTDLTYRNGREIEGHLVDLDGWQDGYSAYEFSSKIKEAMFVGREVSLKLHKLAVYEKGGHFDWHLDATHGEDHQATMLLALNTDWEGGDLVLRRNGVENHFSMKPERYQWNVDVKDRDRAKLQAIAFFTDTEHKVEEVTDGVRIILQFDVLVKEKVNPYQETVGDSDLEVVTIAEVLRGLTDRKPSQDAVPDAADQETIDGIIAFLKTKLESGTSVIGFALQYLHRKSSVLPEYLKGSDAVLYRALIESEIFDVALHPVLLVQQTTAEGRDEKASMVIYASEESPDSWVSMEPLVSSIPNARMFYVNQASALTLLYSQDFIEHRGNEPERGAEKYVGGGMFVRLKRKETV